MGSRLWLPTPISTPTSSTTSAPLPPPKVKVAGPSGTLASGPSTRSSALRRVTFTRKCVKVPVIPLTKVFSSKLSSSSSSLLPPRGTAAHAARGSSSSSSSSTAPKANIVKCDATGERPQQGDSAGCSVSYCDYPFPAEPPPPYQLRVANSAPTSEYDYDYDRSHSAAASSSRFTAASIEAIRAPDSPVPTFPSPKLSTESVFGSTRGSVGSVSDSEDYAALAPANTNGTGTAMPRYICTLRDSAARCGAGQALRRKDTIGFPRRVTLSSGYRSVKPTTSSAPFGS